MQLPTSNISLDMILNLLEVWMSRLQRFNVLGSLKVCLSTNLGHRHKCLLAGSARTVGGGSRRGTRLPAEQSSLTGANTERFLGVISAICLILFGSFCVWEIIM